VLSLVLAALFFTGIHLGIAGTVIRDRAIERLGRNAYMAAFTVASVIGLGWLVTAYNRPPYLATWGMLEWWKPIAIILMLPAALLVVIGFDDAKPDLGRPGGARRAAAAGDCPGHTTSLPDRGRSLGAGESDWQRRRCIAGVLCDLGDRSSRWHRIY
jgi:NnrU protein